MKHILVGTIGHIDHGKTTLLKALTNIDADRLKEEKERGITTDIGFAFMKEEDLQIHFVDLPGHEKFIKNMIAGASGISMFLLVVSANESVMPQTIEHIEIAKYLGISKGVAVITKSDLASDSELKVVKNRTDEFLKSEGFQEIPIFEVSSKSGVGIENLKKFLFESARKMETRNLDKPFKMWIDRVFSLKGFGTIVTGTIKSGVVKVQDEVSFFPSNKKSVARGIQVFGEDRNEGFSQERCAINVPQVTVDEIKRGDLIFKGDSIFKSNLFYANLELKENKLKRNAEYEFYTGTTFSLARIISKEREDFSICQIKVFEDLPLSFKDRFILRMPSPLRTIGGGEILLPSSRKARWEKELSKRMVEFFKKGDVESVIFASILEGEEWGTNIIDLSKKLNIRKEETKEKLIELKNGESIIFFDEIDWVVESSYFSSLKDKILKFILTRHKIPSQRLWLNKEEILSHFSKILNLREIESVLNILVLEDKLKIEKDRVKATELKFLLNDNQSKIYKEMVSLLYLNEINLVEKNALSNIAKENYRFLTSLLIDEYELLSFGKGEFFISKKGMNEIKRKLIDLKKKGTIKFKVPLFKEMFGLTRKVAIPLLEFLDDNKMTRRIGDEREILINEN